MTCVSSIPGARWLSFIAAVGLAACGDRSQSAPAAEAPSPEAPAAEAPAAAPTPAAPATPTPSPAAPPASAEAALANAELGKPAPPVTLTDVDGKTHDLAALKGKTVVLEWFNPDCPFVRAAHGEGTLKEMAKRAQSKDVVWLSINSNAPGKQGHGVERNREAKTQFAMANPILLDESGKVGQSYGALKTPHMFVIDATGKLVYRGGIDNAPMNVVDDARPVPAGSKAGERVNYVDAALQDLKAGKPVRLPDTPPYGCSVKYSS
jgi:peroxiredoxin